MAAKVGRGPTRARAHISEDMIAVILRDCMTKSEMTLIRDGHVDVVMASRRAMQEAMSEELIAIVEDATGRTVETFFSDNRAEPDVAVEVFLLKPRDKTTGGLSS